MSDGDPDDRANRLASRFSASETEETGKTDNSQQTPDASITQETDETPQADEQSDTEETSVRDRKQKLLYLDESFLDELELTFDEVNLRYKREHGEDLQKNRDFYPQLLRLGLEQLGDVHERDLEELKDVLDL